MGRRYRGRRGGRHEGKMAMDMLEGENKNSRGPGSCGKRNVRNREGSMMENGVGKKRAELKRGVYGIRDRLSWGFGRC